MRSTLITVLWLGTSGTVNGANESPLTGEERNAIRAEHQKAIKAADDVIQQMPEQIRAYSSRADARFFLAEFDGALADYEKMIELNSDTEPSHWRRGIAAFYVKDFKTAAKQFELYHTFDDVDRENGIWRYFSQYKAYGPEKARQGLLKYEKTDREPFPSVYKLFAGQMTGDQILDAIKNAKISDLEREKRFFYAQLYIGLNYAVENKPKKAVVHLREAVANKWPRGPRGGYGPAYMWHVGRVHYDLLTREDEQN